MREFVYNQELAQVAFNRDLTAQEKVGHILSRVSLRQPTVEELDKIKLLFKWCNIEWNNQAIVAWDSNARLVRISFGRQDYWNGGNRWFQDAVSAMKANKRGIPLSYHSAPFWVFLLPFPKMGTEPTKPVEVEKPVTVVREEPPPVEEPKPEQEALFTPRVVRNVRRKTKQVETCVHGTELGTPCFECDSGWDD